MEEQGKRKTPEPGETPRLAKPGTTHLHEHVPRMFELQRRHPVPRAARRRLEPRTDPGPSICRQASREYAREVVVRIRKPRRQSN
jgi:hypothetical protein